MKLSKQTGFILGSLLLALLPNFASATAMGGQGPGGGDGCEDRIKAIRDDIQEWINRGESRQLHLPGKMTADQYAAVMLPAIASAKIRCVGPKDKVAVKVFGVPKTCRNETIKKEKWITCDFDKFNGTGESEQYVLIHHEFAGLAKIERPNRGDSNYGVSNQISGHLKEQVIKKLVVAPLPEAKTEADKIPRFNGIRDQPLSALTSDSTFVVDFTNMFFSSGVYQDGKHADQIDDTKPFCTISAEGLRAPTGDSPLVELKIQEMSAFRVVEAKDAAKSSQNWTKIQLSSPQGLLELTCAKRSKTMYLPVTIAEAEQALGNAVSLDQISAKRVVSPKTFIPSYPEEYAVTPWDLLGRADMGRLKVELPPVEIRVEGGGNGYLVGCLQDGKNVVTPDPKKPYAHIAVMDSNRKDLIGKAVTITLDKMREFDISVEAMKYLPVEGKLLIRAVQPDGGEIAILFNSPNGRLPTYSDIRIVTGIQPTWML